MGPHVPNGTYSPNDLMLHTKTQNLIGVLVPEKNILRVLPYMGRGHESHFSQWPETKCHIYNVLSNEYSI